MTFDEQVAALRGKVEPSAWKAGKSAATALQWAAYLDYRTAWRAARRQSIRDYDRALNKRNATQRRESGRRSHRRRRDRGAVEAYRRMRISTDHAFRIREGLRLRFVAAIRGSAKSGSAVRDLGCSVADLKAHLERQCLPGMTWDNWGSGEGKWQIDHIYPLAQADLTVRLVVLAVCNWRNLQPLWFKDNNRKGDTVTPEAQQLFDGLVSEFTDNEGGE